MKRTIRLVFCLLTIFLLPLVSSAILQGYEDDFSGTSGSKVPGWMDESDNSDFNARIEYSSASHAKVIRTPESTWGKVLSPVLVATVGAVKDYDTLELKVDGISANASYSVGIQEMVSPWRHWFLQENSTATGTMIFNYSNATQWAPGIYTFAVEIIVGGGAGEYIDLDRIAVENGTGPVYTATPTNTPTSSITATATPTPTPTQGQPNPVQWSNDFSDGTPGQPVPGWLDETYNSDFNAEIAYAPLTSCARVMRTAESSWGKVLSPVLVTTIGTVKDYDTLEIKADGLSANTNWSIGIQEMVSPWRHWFLQQNSTATGTFVFNYSTLAQWAPGTYTFAIEIIVGGGAGTYLDIDRITVESGTGPVVTASPTSTPTQSATATSTCTATPVITATATATSTPDGWTLIGQNLSNATAGSTNEWVQTSLAVSQNQLCLAGNGASMGLDVWIYNGTSWNHKLNDFTYSYPEVQAIADDISGFYVGFTQKIEPGHGTDYSSAGALKYDGGAWTQPPIFGSHSDYYNHLWAYARSVATSGPNLYLAWLTENFIYVTGPDGNGGYTQMHEALNQAGTTDSMNVKMACTGSGVPYVAYVDRINGGYQLYVKHWNGQIWQQDGVALNNISSDWVGTPQIATYGEEIYVSWRENLSEGNGIVCVKHWDASIGCWVIMGSDLNNGLPNSFSQQLVISHSGIPYVILDENGKIHVKHWNGNAWVQDGGDLNLITPNTAFRVSVAISDTHVYAAWVEANGDNTVGVNVKQMTLTNPAPTRTVTLTKTPTPIVTSTATNAMTVTPTLTLTSTITMTPTIYMSPTMTVTITPAPTSVHGNWTLIGQGINSNPNDFDETSLNFYQGQLCAGVMQNIWQNARVFTCVYNGAGWDPVQYIMAPSAEEFVSSEFRLRGTSGALYACYTDLPHYFAPDYDMYHHAALCRYNGSAWETIGYATNTPTASNALSLLTQGENVYLAYGSGPNGNEEMHVVRWNGSGFVPLGGQINTNAFSGGELGCTADGTPYIAYCEFISDETYFGNYFLVKRWNGQTWEPVGPNLGLNSPNSELRIAASGDEVYVAWSEVVGSTWHLNVKHWNNVSGSWENVGGGVSGPTDNNYAPYSLAMNNAGELYATYSLIGQVFVSHWNGSVWLLDGACLNLNPNHFAKCPSITISDDHVYVGWNEFDPASSSYSMNVKSLNLSTAQGSAMSALHCPKTATPTVTRTMTAIPTLTPTPPKPAATATVTATTTPTPTVTPWLAEQKVMVYPNPARDRVMFAYTVSGAANITLDLYKISGERVAHIVEAKNGGAGQTLTTTWEAADVAPGVYICRLVIRDGEGKLILEQKKKVALVK